MRSSARLAALLLAAGTLAACGSFPATQGRATGWMLRVGGAAAGHPTPVAGVVTLTDLASGVRYALRCSRQGVWSAEVPPGAYRVAGESLRALSDGHRMRARPADAVVQVRHGQTVHDDLYVQIR